MIRQLCTLGGSKEIVPCCPIFVPLAGCCLADALLLHKMKGELIWSM